MNNLFFILPSTGQPRYHKRIIEFSKTYSIIILHFTRDYNNLNELPRSFKKINLGSIEAGNYFKRFFKLIRPFFKTITLFKKKDIIYSFSYDLLLLSLITKKAQCKIWYEIGDLRFPRSVFFNRIYDFLNKYFIYKKVDKIIVTSDGFKDYIVNKYNYPSDQIEVKYNFVDKKLLQQISQPNTNLAKRFTVGIIGFFRYESILNFIKCYINNVDNNFDIYIKGQGPLIKHITKFTNSHITYHGEFKYPDELNNVYDNFDISFVMYDNSDLNVQLALPNKLYESILYKKPIIVSKGTKLCEIVTKLNIGRCFEYTNQNDVVKYLNSKALKNDYYNFVRSMNEIPNEEYIN